MSPKTSRLPAVLIAGAAGLAARVLYDRFGRFEIAEASMTPALRPGDYVVTDQPCLFSDLMYAAQQKQEIALGVRTAVNNGGRLWLNPDRQQRWQFGDNDRVVVLAQQVYR